ncbi:hypothetical protein [Bilifractor sp. HCP3S3_D3]|uniref:hypothetical protein n=1 Tax=Bilifractor sp. HCP3S3_D3 TaxID=3438907 RepID=UPI003F8928D4
MGRTDADETRRAVDLYRKVTTMLDTDNAEVKVRKAKNGELRIVQLNCGTTATV